MTIHHSMTVPAPVERVTEMLCSEKYNLLTQTSREDVVEARFEPGEETDAELRYKLYVRHYKRTKTGKYDRSVIEQSTTRYRFDKRTGALHWQHEGPEGKRVDVHGTTRLVRVGDRTRIDRQVEIKISIPVIGRGLSKIVEREFSKGFVRMERLVLDTIEEF